MITCTAVFDIGKTNKKLLLFDEKFNIVHEIQSKFEEIKDDDGDNCEDLNELTNWMLNSWNQLESNNQFDVKALNFATYGASFVHLDADLKPITPLYNYLKPLPAQIENKFFESYGDKMEFATTTASPNLGLLNSGLQIYWLKYAKPELFKSIKHSLHFPQYCSFLFTKQLCTEFTSIGCHTGLWDMGKNDYHTFVYQEGFDKLFPKITKKHFNGTTAFRGNQISVGTGLHDSSAALIPYLQKFSEPFVLLSTGTWCIALNPFAKKLLAKSELLNDCLNYMTFEGNQVKASRLFLGNFHEIITKLFASHFNKPLDYYKGITFNPIILETVKLKEVLLKDRFNPEPNIKESNLNQFNTYEEAYHKLLNEMTDFQVDALQMAGENFENIKNVYVDGGFNKNNLFMTLLQQKLPKINVQAFEISQGTSLGAARVMYNV